MSQAGQIRSFVVEGLFHNSLTHKIVFSRDSPVTILAGPNGVGKTHILRLIHAILRLKAETIFDIPFQCAELKFSDGKTLAITREPDEDSGTRVTLVGTGPRGGHLGTATLVEDEMFQLTSARWDELPDGTYFDRHTGRIVSRGFITDWARRRASIERRRGSRERAFFLVPGKNDAWLREIMGIRESIFIDTKRLDTPRTKGGSSESPPAPRSRIDEYIEQVKLQVTDARRESLAVTQEADQSFAARVLKRTKRTIEPEELKRKYEEIAEQNVELSNSGLSGTQVDVEFPSSGVDATERRVLAVFIDDWRRKLAPLLPVNEKLKILQRIVNEKFMGKRLRLDGSGTLIFVAESDKTPIPVHLLSSGEQHILALFTMLLFSAKPGSVVLIDEPEISLHAAWKHSFLNDITDVAAVANLQIILATHSSAIINGQWDLVQELGIRG